MLEIPRHARMQHLLAATAWDDKGLRADLRDCQTFALRGPRRRNADLSAWGARAAGQFLISG